MSCKNVLKVLTAAFAAVSLAVFASAAVSMTEEEAKALERIAEYSYCDAVGDVDRNSLLEPADARLILRASVRLEKLDKDQLERADMDADGDVTSADARSALRCSIGADRRPPHSREKIVIKAATCGERGYAIEYCLTCHKLYAEERTPPTDHAAGVWEVKKPATCQEEGLSELKCINCGAVIRTDVLPKGDHVYGEWVYPNGKSCLESVKRYRDCTLCGARQNDVVPAAGAHRYEWVVTKEATCTEDGVNSYMCVNCEKLNYSETIPAKGHDAEDWTVTKTATCTEDGLREKICLNCGASLEQEKIPATDHDFNNGHYKVLIAPTCQTEGKAEGICSVCGEKHDIILEKTEHDYKIAPYTIRQVSCTQDGIIEAECRYCGVIRETIPAPGHQVEWHRAKEPTCSEEGEDVAVCSVCGVTVERKALPKAAHSYGTKTTMITEPTCIDAGSCYVTCKICGDKLIRDLPPTGKHTPGDQPYTTREATCTEDRYIIYRCKYCGSDIPETEKPDKGTALGHDFKSWTTVVSPSCVLAGKKESVCARCGAEALEEIAPLGHQPTGEWELAEASTCTKAGLEVVRCKYCGDAVQTRQLPKKDHTPVTKIISVASCIAEGRETVQCSVCGELLESRVTPMTAHSPVYSITRQPTCTEEGETTAVCSVCGQTLSTNPIPKAAHTPVIITEKLPTCQETGLNLEKCSVCDTLLREIETPKTTHRYVAGEVIQPAALSTFRWDGKKGTMYGWQGTRCAYCGDIKDDVKYVRLSISGDWEPVFEAGTNPDAGKFIFKMKNPAAYEHISSVVYSVGKDSAITEIKSVDGVYSLTVPASVSRTDTVNIFIVSE